MTDSNMSETSLPETLLQTLQQLTAHLEKENELLAAREPAALEPLAAEKNRLTDAYLEAMAVVRRNPDVLAGVSAELKSRLHEAGEAFNTVFEEHRRRVTALKNISEGVIKAVSRQADSKNRLSDTYGETALPTRSAPTKPTSIAVDQQI